MGKLDTLNEAEHCLYTIRYHMVCDDAPLMRGMIATMIEVMQDHLAKAYGEYLQDMMNAENELHGKTEE